ncbi:hypothetical protein LBMAG42_23030 [Deltaproteobacteria bacterium]|nr:hypothetical protein LBMAG42_23030 [Deltaproteobacteria bacterium]
MAVDSSPLPRPRRAPAVIESEVFAMIVWIFAEVMMFAGFLSAYNLVGARAPAGWWPPPGDPILPWAPTAGASVALVFSAALVVWGGFRPLHERRALGIAVPLGAVFVVYQIVEFARLLSVGFTLQSSAGGGFFFTIVGAHALHAIAGLGALAWVAARRGNVTEGLAKAIRLYWYFVVLLWPVIYAVIYGPSISPGLPALAI